MKRFKIIQPLLIVVLTALVSANAIAQSTYHIATSKASKLTVLGSSNVHDWTMSSETMESQGEFKFDANGQLTSLTAFSFSVAAKSLKSEHTTMDERTYKTIKADQFPKITFKLNNAVINSSSAGHYQLKATGTLTIAGTTKPVTLNVNAIATAGKIISCTGTQALKLTDFGIEPPTFMLGAMKVKNDLTVQFEINYESIH